MLVACTQEAPLFAELAEQAGAKHELQFVNIRETAGWSKESGLRTPKIAALLALADLPEPEPLPATSYSSGGQLLIIGSGGRRAAVGRTADGTARSERAPDLRPPAANFRRSAAIRSGRAG